jgi:hypothetical protein
MLLVIGISTWTIPTEPMKKNAGNLLNELEMQIARKIAVKFM